MHEPGRRSSSSFGGCGGRCNLRSLAVAGAFCCCAVGWVRRAGGATVIAPTSGLCVCHHTNAHSRPCVCGRQQLIVLLRRSVQGRLLLTAAWQQRWRCWRRYLGNCVWGLAGSRVGAMAAVVGLGPTDKNCCCVKSCWRHRCYCACVRPGGSTCTRRCVCDV